MNKIAIRILMRVLDALVEQTDEVKYAHKAHARAFPMLTAVLHDLRSAKSRLVDLVEGAD